MKSENPEPNTQNTPILEKPVAFFYFSKNILKKLFLKIKKNPEPQNSPFETPNPRVSEATGGSSHRVLLGHSFVFRSLFYQGLIQIEGGSPLYRILK